ncbi:MAG TPA: alpha/beta hydrolase [Acetobacteraceae bacterium]|jgi:pimeloyl-ACP methyl ester carboxylesterase|nr:alpha/beta hydrolase [Acetobacteraceae bacterium]
MASEPTQRDVACNGVRLRITEQGGGPLVLLLHGWPELAYSWRHQIPALAEAGWHVVAPDMRGFGGSEAPEPVGQYTVLHLVGDMVALASEMGERQAVIVGHDWGANIAWTAALLRPDLFRAVAALSVPFRPRGPVPPLAAVRRAGLDRFYWIYFQEQGVAEAEFEADPTATLRRILYSGSGDAPRREGLALTLPEDGGFLSRTLEPSALPGWLTARDLETMAASFRRTGFRGGLNYYRNLDRNWELLAPWQGALVTPPALFIAGTRDVVINSPIATGWQDAMAAYVPNLRETVLIEGGGHWIQQERPAEVNAALLRFLAELSAPRH